MSNLTFKHLMISIFIMLLCTCFYTIAYSDGIEVHNSPHYSVIKDERGGITIINNKKQSVRRKHFDITVEQIELCYSYPFVSLKGKCDDGRQKNYIYDIEQDYLYKEQLFLDMDEQRWSFDGKYTYLRDEVSFSIIETRFLSEYLREPSKVSALKITGNPMGYIWQVKWIGNYLIYANGVDGRECVGYVDIEKNENYFLTCCGMAKHKEYSVPCDKITTSTDYLINKYVETIELGNKTIISNDFYREVLNILKK